MWNLIIYESVDNYGIMMKKSNSNLSSIVLAEEMLQKSDLGILL